MPLGFNLLMSIWLPPVKLRMKRAVVSVEIAIAGTELGQLGLPVDGQNPAALTLVA